MPDDLSKMSLSELAEALFDENGSSESDPLSSVTEPIRAELRRREERERRLRTATHMLLDRFVAVCPDTAGATCEADAERIAEVRATLAEYKE